MGREKINFDIEKATALYAQERSLDKTARAMRVSTYTAYERLKAAGVPMCPRGIRKGSQYPRMVKGDRLNLEQRIVKLRPLIKGGSVRTLRQISEAIGLHGRERARQILNEAWEKKLIPEITEALKESSRGMVRAWGKAQGLAEKPKTISGKPEDEFLSTLAKEGRTRELAKALGKRTLARAVIDLSERYGFKNLKRNGKTSFSQKRFLLSLVAQMKGLVTGIHDDALPIADYSGYYAPALKTANDGAKNPEGAAGIRTCQAMAQLCKTFGLSPQSSYRVEDREGKWKTPLKIFVSQQLAQGRTLEYLRREALGKPVLEAHREALEKIRAGIEREKELKI